MLVLSVFVLSVFRLSVFGLSVFRLSVFGLSVLGLSKLLFFGRQCLSEHFSISEVEFFMKSIIAKNLKLSLTCLEFSNLTFIFRLFVLLVGLFQPRANFFFSPF